MNEEKFFALGSNWIKINSTLKNVGNLMHFLKIALNNIFKECKLTSWLTVQVTGFACHEICSILIEKI